MAMFMKFEEYDLRIQIKFDICLQIQSYIYTSPNYKFVYSSMYNRISRGYRRTIFDQDRIN